MANEIPPDKRRYLPKSYVPKNNTKTQDKNNDTKKHQPIVVKKEKYICGHEIDINLLKTKNCRECDKKYKKGRKERNYKKKQQKIEEGIKGNGSNWKLNASKQLNTFPDGSEFLDIVKRDGLWYGTLKIPYLNNFQKFVGEPCESLYRLQSNLNNQYVAWAKENSLEVPTNKKD